MSIDIKGALGRGIATGDSGRTRATSGNRTSKGASRPSSGSGTDKVSLTNSATQLQELAAQIANQPAEDAQHVSDVQRSIASGNYHFEPEDAAEQLLAQEREFATNGDTE